MTRAYCDDRDREREMLVEARVVAVGDETRNETEGVTPRKKTQRE